MLLTDNILYLVNRYNFFTVTAIIYECNIKVDYIIFSEKNALVELFARPNFSAAITGLKRLLISENSIFGSCSCVHYGHRG